MSFAPDPDTGDLEGSIGAWVTDSAVSMVGRDTALARSGAASLRVTNTATPTPSLDTRAIAYIAPMATVATAPAPGGVGTVTVSGWYYVSDPAIDLVDFSVGVYDAAFDSEWHGSVQHGDFGIAPVTHDAWTQMVVVIGELDPSQVASFSITLIGGTFDAVQIPAGTFMHWDDFDYTGALGVAVACPPQSAALARTIAVRLTTDPPVVIRCPSASVTARAI